MITQLEQNTVSRGASAALLIVEQIYPALKRLNIDYDSSGGVKETLTQAELDSIASFSGLTKAQLDDGMFALTSTLRTDIETAFSQLEQLAGRA